MNFITVVFLRLKFILCISNLRVFKKFIIEFQLILVCYFLKMLYNNKDGLFTMSFIYLVYFLFWLNHHRTVIWMPTSYLKGPMFPIWTQISSVLIVVFLSPFRQITRYCTILKYACTISTFFSIHHSQSSVYLKQDNLYSWGNAVKSKKHTSCCKCPIMTNKEKEWYYGLKLHVTSTHVVRHDCFTLVVLFHYWRQTSVLEYAFLLLLFQCAMKIMHATEWPEGLTVLYSPKAAHCSRKFNWEQASQQQSIKWIQSNAEVMYSVMATKK